MGTSKRNHQDIFVWPVHCISSGYPTSFISMSNPRGRRRYIARYQDPTVIPVRAAALSTSIHTCLDTTVAPDAAFQLKKLVEKIDWLVSQGFLMQ